MPQRFPLLFVKDRATVDSYRKPGGGGSKMPSPPRTPQEHGIALEGALNEVWKEFRTEQVNRFAEELPVASGLQVTFFSSPGFLLQLKSLESLNRGIRLSTVGSHTTADEEERVYAVVFIPGGQEGYFLRKIQKYLEGEGEKRKNQALVESIDQIQRTVLEHFWQDQTGSIPEDVAVWCECWVRLDADQNRTTARKRLEELCDLFDIELSEDIIYFPERAVYLLRANYEQLTELLSSYDYLAELRKARQPVSFWVKEPNTEQQEWVAELRERLQLAEDSQVRILVLDSGVNNGHQLLADFLKDEDCHAYNPEWGTADSGGHGTYMAGLALYDDLHELLQSKEAVAIHHRLESGKILPPRGQNPKRLYGAITGQVISRAEIQNAGANRIVCLAVTQDGDNRGHPTSWSGKIDALASGYNEEDDRKRLVVISAGNIADHQKWCEYPDVVVVSAVEDPSQAWNALVVGAYTQRTLIHDQTFKDYNPIAPAQGLSPFTTTSTVWDNDWPQKPDVVMEGGNAGVDASSFVSYIDDLGILSLSHETAIRQFDVQVGTSPAAAKAAHLCALIQVQYPDAWPETVRGLVVHAARWTDAMQEHFLDGDGKKDYERLLRCCGYGVPNVEKALYCSENFLTMIAQETIQPYYQPDKGNPKTRDVHYFDMPWPASILNELGSTEVTMRITLSYFVEPSPGEIGWRDRYRYASHSLRFDVNNYTEQKEDFRKRINAAARADDEKIKSNNDSNRWLIGSQARDRGSIHTDQITTTAAQLADCRHMAVYPIGGWWKNRSHIGRAESSARYSLIVTLETAATEVDIYTEVANQIKTPIKVL